MKLTAALAVIPLFVSGHCDAAPIPAELLCREVFGDNDWRYVRSDDPSRRDEPHLKGLDRSALVPFAMDR